MDTSTPRRLALGAVALSVVVAPLAATSSPASGQAAPSAATGALDPTLAEPGSAGLPDRDQRYGKKGAPSVLQVAQGKALTKPSDAAPDAIARAYLTAHQADFGLTAEEVDALRVTMTDQQSGASFLRYQQVSEGRDVVRRHGAGHRRREGPGRAARAATSCPTPAAAPAAALTAADAVAVVAGRRRAGPGHRARPAPRRPGRHGDVREHPEPCPTTPSAAPVEARAGHGRDLGRRPHRVAGQAERASNAVYTVLVDAVTGEVLLRNNEVSASTTRAPSSRARTPRPAVGQPDRLPRRLGDRGDTTSGNNVNAYQDAEGDNSAQAARPAAERRPALRTTPGATRGAPAPPAPRPTCR